MWTTQDGEEDELGGLLPMFPDGRRRLRGPMFHGVISRMGMSSTTSARRRTARGEDPLRVAEHEGDDGDVRRGRRRSSSQDPRRRPTGIVSGDDGDAPRQADVMQASEGTGRDPGERDRPCSSLWKVILSL